MDEKKNHPRSTTDPAGFVGWNADFRDSMYSQLMHQSLKSKSRALNDFLIVNDNHALKRKSGSIDPGGIANRTMIACNCSTASVERVDKKNPVVDTSSIVVGKKGKGGNSRRSLQYASLELDAHKESCRSFVLIDSQMELYIDNDRVMPSYTSTGSIAASALNHMNFLDNRTNAFDESRELVDTKSFINSIRGIPANRAISLANEIVTSGDIEKKYRKGLLQQLMKKSPVDPIDYAAALSKANNMLVYRWAFEKTFAPAVQQAQTKFAIKHQGTFTRPKTVANKWFDLADSCDATTIKNCLTPYFAIISFFDVRRKSGSWIRMFTDNKPLNNEICDILRDVDVSMRKKLDQANKRKPIEHSTRLVRAYSESSKEVARFIKCK